MTRFNSTKVLTTLALTLALGFTAVAASAQNAAGVGRGYNDNDRDAGERESFIAVFRGDDRPEYPYPTREEVLDICEGIAGLRIAVRGRGLTCFDEFNRVVAQYRP